MKLVPPFFFLLILCLTSCATSSPEEEEALFENGNTPLDNEVITASSSELELLDLVNEHRTANGFSQLEFSAAAYPEATDHTNYMIAEGKLSHDNFDKRASKIAQKTKAKVVSENVAKDYDSGLEALNGWLASKDHKKTIEGDFSHTAISIKQDASGSTYITQVFFKK